MTIAIIPARLVQPIAAFMLLAAIVAPARAQTATRQIPWDTLTTEGVVKAHIWVVNLVQLDKETSVCEAIAQGRSGDAPYAMRIWAVSPSPLLIFSRPGPPFRDVRSVALTLDDAPVATLPIKRSQAFGDDQAVVVALTDPVWGQMLKRMNTARLLTVYVEGQDFSVPVTGFDDVTRAIGRCQDYLRARSHKPKA